MNPIKKYKENQFLIKVLIQTLVLALNENTISNNVLSQQLSTITEKQPAEQEDLNIRGKKAN